MMTEHLKFVEALNNKYLWEIYIEGMNLPKARKELSKENAQWFLQQGYKLNKTKKYYKELMEVCESHVALNP